MVCCLMQGQQGLGSRFVNSSDFLLLCCRSPSQGFFFMVIASQIRSNGEGLLVSFLEQQRHRRKNKHTKGLKTCSLKVNIHCDDCKRKVKKILQKRTVLMRHTHGVLPFFSCSDNGLCKHFFNGGQIYMSSN